jgi:hypothetical protein
MIAGRLVARWHPSQLVTHPALDSVPSAVQDLSQVRNESQIWAAIQEYSEPTDMGLASLRTKPSCACPAPGVWTSPYDRKVNEWHSPQSS